ncbi:Zn-ribbon domain-containing OB-fold protein [Pseudomonas sp. JAI120]|uniref:Zn-ribbon domain-containing OB-fold protein n=1 Tax=Pseudomonas sp. JAI120 TaxID=2723063 RepID=UPI0030ED8AFC
MNQNTFQRILPQVTELNQHFWSGGEDGKLHLLQCRDCKKHVHPPLPICNRCRSRNLEVVTVSGKAQVASFTINHQPWFPGLAVPYCVAIVELNEEAGLRLTTNIVHCAPEEVRIGMPVCVTFEQHEDVWLPMFEPDTNTTCGE